MWFTYVLYNKVINKFYIGATNNIKRRLEEHASKSVTTTSKSGDWGCVYFEGCLSKKDAFRREKELKTGYGRGYLRKRVTNYLDSLNNIQPK